MLIPFSILKKYLQTDENIKQISEKLTDIGLEVEKIKMRTDLEDFIVAEIIDFEKHPNADKLNVCKVNNGTEILQIVCGAPNVQKNMKVVLAPVGTMIPRDNFAIKNAKIRGVDSYGMMCSSSELNLGNDSEGIIHLPNWFVIGEKYATQAGVNDPVIEISLTPNRGDCASIYGIARDLSATGIGKLNKIEIPDLSANDNNLLDSIDKAICKKFGAIRISNVSCISSPPWLQMDLQKFGIKPRNLLVDITNYIMMVFGQPMHCFDADKITGKISVKQIEKSDIMIDLKNEEQKLEKGDIVICDEKSIISLAGIIGGKDSAVAENTKNVILEAAYFDKHQIAKTSQRLNIITDAKFRFERGTDYKMINFALEFAKNTILESIPDMQIEDISMFDDKFADSIIAYNFAKFKKVCGIDISIEKQLEIINNLELKVNNITNDGCNIIIPSHRHDISNETDIVEEILRIYGYNNLEETPMRIIANQGDGNKLLQIKRLIASFGYDEIITFVFQNNKLVNDMRYKNQDLIEIFNPISHNESTLRQSLLPGLFDRICDMLRMDGNRSINLFEEGSVFLDNVNFENQNHIALMSVGNFGNEDYTKSQQKSSWHIAKTHLYNILTIGGIDLSNINLVKANLNFTHPYRSFYLEKNGSKIAIFGELNPLYTSEFDIKNTISFVEILDIKSLYSNNIQIGFQENHLQPIYRECSFLCKKSIKIGDLIDKMQSFSNKIQNIILIDIYTNPEWNNDFSITLRIKIEQITIMNLEQIDEVFFGTIKVATENFDLKLRDGN